MKFNIDINEMEQQRYNHIKKSGHYLELDVLIGANDDEHNGKTEKMPVVTTCIHGCGSSEISALYMILGLLRDHLEEEYPMECLMANIGMKSQFMGSVESKIPHDEED